MSELLEDQKQLYEKNLKLFKSRFSELYKLLEKKLGNLPENVEVLSCKEIFQKELENIIINFYIQLTIQSEKGKNFYKRKSPKIKMLMYWFFMDLD